MRAQVSRPGVGEARVGRYEYRTGTVVGVRFVVYCLLRLSWSER